MTGGHGGVDRRAGMLNPSHETPAQKSGVNMIAEQTPNPSVYRGQPVVFIVDADGVTRPAPYLLSPDELAGLLRIHATGIRFGRKSIERYRRLWALKPIRLGRRAWYVLPDVLDALDRQRQRLQGE